MISERLVIKVGTNVLTQPNQQLDYNVIHQIVEQIGRLRQEKHRVVLVTSGAAGASYGLGNFEGQKKNLVRRQMMTAVGQPRLMQIYSDFFREHNITVAQALLTRSDFGNRERYLNIHNTLEGLLMMGTLPIVNENDVVVTDALTFGDNDYLSAAVASTIGANRLFLLTTANGFYLGGDPEFNPSANIQPEVARISQEMWDSCGATLSKGGRGGMLSKLKAVEMVASFGIESYIVSGKQPGVVPRIMAGEALGTRFLPTEKRLKTYRQWLRFGALTSGRIVVDAGAEKALGNNKSLLPAGIDKVEGNFNEGDIVEIRNRGQEKLGVGLSNFSAEALTAMIEGSRPITRSEEAIHRDRMLLL
ncbi:MAG: glutamate 5-kinase [SAR324 cluster bacterium]|nr:glutamate 5-kinase [SAR324 cluster bacterium]